jgi:hypothetical protein
MRQPDRRTPDRIKRCAVDVLQLVDDRVLHFKLSRRNGCGVFEVKEDSPASFVQRGFNKILAP